MNNRKISNPKTEVKEGLEMNDCDYLSAALELEKNMSNNYSIALNEASNEELYEDYFELFEDTKDMARECFELMFQKGWYTLEEEQEEKVQQKIQELTTKLESLED